LGLRENPLSSSLQKETILFVAVQVAHAICVLNQIAICICSVIVGDSFQPVEKVPSIDLDESIDADIADISGVAVVAVTNVAMLLDLLPAGVIGPIRR